MREGLRRRIKRLTVKAEARKPFQPVVVAWQVPGGLEVQGKTYPDADAIRRAHPGYNPRLIFIFSSYDATQPAHDGPSEV